MEQLKQEQTKNLPPQSRGGRRRNRALQASMRSQNPSRSQITKSFQDQNQQPDKEQQQGVDIIDLKNNQSFCQESNEYSINFSSESVESESNRKKVHSSGKSNEEYNITIEEPYKTNTQNIDYSYNVEQSNVQLQTHNNIQEFTDINPDQQYTDNNTKTILLKLPENQPQQKQQQQLQQQGIHKLKGSNNYISSHNTLTTNVDLDKKQDIEMKKITYNRMVRFTMYGFILSLIAACLGFIIYLILKEESVIDNDENTCLGKFRDLSKGCQCIKGYYDKGDTVNCVGPFNEDFDIEDITVSLKGQEKNFVTRVFKKQQIQYYQYNLENSQYNTIDGVLHKNTTNFVYNIGIFTKNVTIDSVNSILFIQNRSCIHENGQKEYIEGYPKQFENIDNLSEENNNNSDTDGEQLGELPLNVWQIQQIQTANITKEQYLFSQWPIVELKMNKQGEILQVFYPINLPSDIKGILPNIINQYSPPLEESSFTQIDEVETKSGKRRRILNGTPSKNVSEPGQYGETSNLSYSADINSDINKAEIYKQYSQETDHKGGKQFQQNQSLNQKTDIQDGIVKESSTQGSMDLTNPEGVESETDVNVDGELDEIGGNLMGDVKLEQFVTFKLLRQEIGNEEFTNKIVKDLSQNIKKNNTYRGLKEELIEEKNVLNKQVIQEQLKSKNPEEEFGFDDGEIERLGDMEIVILNSDEELEQHMRDEDEKSKKRMLGSGGYIVEPFQKDIFKFRYLAIKVHTFLKFFCYYSPETQKNDICEFKPYFDFGLFSFTYGSFKFKIPLTKMARRFNWYRNEIMNRVLYAGDVLVQNLNDIQKDSGEVIEAVHNSLDVTKNELAKNLDTSNIQFQTDIKKKYSEFQQSFDILLKKQHQKLSIPVEKTKTDIIQFTTSYFREIDSIWENLEEGFGGNLDQMQQEIQTSEEVSQDKFEVISGLKDEFLSYSEEFKLSLKQNVENLAKNSIYQPLYQFFLNLQPKEKEVDEIYKENHKKFSNIMNSMLTNFVQGQLNTFIEFTKENINLHSELTKKKLELISNKIAQKLENLKEKAQQKLNTSTEESPEKMEQFFSKISISEYIQYQDLHFQQKSEGVQVIDEQSLQYFEKVFQESQFEKQNLENAFFWFNQVFERKYKDNFSDLSEKLKAMSSNLNENLSNTRSIIEEKIGNIVSTGSTLIPQIKEAIQQGNMMNYEANSALDFDSIQQQIDSILDMSQEVDKADEIISKSKSVPEKFAEIQNFIKEKTVDNWDQFEEISLGLEHASDFDVQDLNIGLFSELFESKRDFIENQIKKEVKESIQEPFIDDFREHIKQQTDSMKNSMQKRVFEEIFDFDSMFREELKNILAKYKMEKQTLFNFNLMDQYYGLKSNILTPIGIDFFADFMITMKLDVRLDVQVKGRSTVADVVFTLQSDASVDGGIIFLVIKLGAYVSAALFNGYMIFSFGLSFKEKVKGDISLTFIIKPYRNKVGLYVWYRKIRFKKRCFNLFFTTLCIPFPYLEWGYKQDLIDPFIFETFTNKIRRSFKTSI